MEDEPSVKKRRQEPTLSSLTSLPRHNCLLAFLESGVSGFALLDDLEVELRVGTFRVGSSRVSLPILLPTVLQPSFKKQADMTLTECDFSILKGAVVSEMAASQIAAEHTKTTDEVYNNGARVTTDGDGKVARCVRKQRLFVADICVPGARYDLRFAVNREAECQPPTGQPNYWRAKDRTTIHCGDLQYDITVVDTRGAAKQYEVEIETKISGDHSKRCAQLANLLDAALSLLDKLDKSHFT